MDTKVVIAVTRAGLGDWLLFDTFEEADEHPLVQYGDVIMTHPAAFLEQWTRLELPRLLESLELGHLPMDREGLLRSKDVIWARMRGRSKRPPEDPAVICDTVVRDRKLTKIERSKRVTDTATKTETTPKPAANQRRYRGDAKVTLLTDKDGKPYGPNNNPKRPGSKTHERFKLYKNGKTVEELLADGAVYSDFKYDEDKGFVKFTDPS